MLKKNNNNNPGFPGGAVVESPPADAGDTGSCSGPGGSHMPQSGWAREPRPLSLRVRSLCSTTGEATAVRGPRTGKKKMETLLAKLNLGLLVPLRSFTLWTQEVSLPSKMCPGHNCETDPVYTRTPALSSSPSPGARPPLSRASPFIDTEAHVMDNRELEFVT